MPVDSVHRDRRRRERHDLGRRDRAPPPDEMDRRADPPAGLERPRGDDEGLQPDAVRPFHAGLRQRRRPRQRGLPGPVPPVDRDRDLPRQEPVQPLAGLDRGLQRPGLHEGRRRQLVEEPRSGRPRSSPSTPRRTSSAGYDHGRKAGVVFVGDHNVVPGKKLWTWGTGSEGKTWEKILTDDDGPYLELMIGAWSDNQPDYSWIQPGRGAVGHPVLVSDPRPGRAEERQPRGRLRPRGRAGTGPGSPSMRPRRGRGPGASSGPATRSSSRTTFDIGPGVAVSSRTSRSPPGSRRTSLDLELFDAGRPRAHRATPRGRRRTRRCRRRSRRRPRPRTSRRTKSSISPDCGSSSSTIRPSNPILIMKRRCGATRPTSGSIRPLASSI